MTDPHSPQIGAASAGVDSSYAWMRLGVGLLLGTIGSIGMWSYVVALPVVQADFGLSRNEASLPYTMAMLGFGVGGILMGRLSDRVGIVWPMIAGSVSLALGYAASGLAGNIWMLAMAQALVGFGASATFGPLMVDMSHWFARRRGIAVAIASSGNYLAGTIWPPVVQHFIAAEGWRATHIGIGLMVLVAMPPLVLALRRRAPAGSVAAGVAGAGTSAALGVSPNVLQWLLIVAGVACCVAMAMPQVHIVAYCGDLGYGVARGAEMLSLMLGLGIVSRLSAGLVADRIGGLTTLLIGSALQGLALLLYLGFDGLTSLYVISGLFGLFQGGIVPMYAIIIREYFPPRDAATRLGIVLMATLVGMALGGWMSGAIFDLTGSYQAAFLNGIAWNLLNLSIIGWLLLRIHRMRREVMA
ncbi:MAG: major facilitator superfamily protein [Xanthobacteraceae bacterium]|nr:major facilitator superfamily protein [Xanthobacteraceae bacterium]